LDDAEVVRNWRGRAASTLLMLSAAYYSGSTSPCTLPSSNRLSAPAAPSATETKCLAWMLQRWRGRGNLQHHPCTSELCADFAPVGGPMAPTQVPVLVLCHPSQGLPCALTSGQPSAAADPPILVTAVLFDSSEGRCRRNCSESPEPLLPSVA
jgi:hypothetical protein